MNKLIALMALSLVSVNSLMADDQRPSETLIVPEHVFTPMGFDDNDNSQIVIAGKLPTPCHVLGPVEVRTDEAGKRILLKAHVYYQTEKRGKPCLNVRIPFDKTVDIGLLRAGKYSIGAMDSTGRVRLVGTLPVSVADSSSMDENLYAPVREAQVEDRSGSYAKLVLRGEWPMEKCMRMKAVKVVHSRPNVVEVLPIAEVFRDGKCPTFAGSTPGFMPFYERVTVRLNTKDESLIHIRAMNGQSQNLVVGFK